MRKVPRWDDKAKREGESHPEAVTGEWVLLHHRHSYGLKKKKEKN